MNQCNHAALIRGAIRGQTYFSEAVIRLRAFLPLPTPPLSCAFFHSRPTTFRAVRKLKSSSLVMVMVMVTLFIHGKSFSKYYKMIQDQLIIPN